MFTACMQATGTRLEAEEMELSTYKSNSVVNEPCMICVATDKTDTDWKRSRYNYSMSCSSSVTDLYSAIAKEAGYVEGTFDLVWRKQNTDAHGEEEVALEWKSSATLNEMGMPIDPVKSYLLIREMKDGTLPQRIQEDRTFPENWEMELSTYKSNSIVNKLCVIFVATDETDTDWKRSRYNYSMSCSSSVTDLYSAIAKEAGYVEGTFDLVWRKQNTDAHSEEDVALEWKSSTTLNEMGMPIDPVKSYLLIRERKDGTLPQRIQEETSEEVAVSSSYPSTTVKVNNTSSYNSYSTNYYSNYSYSMKSETAMDGVILLKDSPGEKTESDASFVSLLKVSLGLMRTKQPCVVVRGELLVPVPEDEISVRNDGKKPHNYRLKRDPTVSLFCTDDIAPLGNYDFLLLEGISSRTVRYEVFISPNEILEWGSKLKRGDVVLVGLPTQTTAPTQNAAAVIRYVGGLKTKPGMKFGVEITDQQFRGCGSTNGLFQGTRYFECEENCGLFVGLDKLSHDPQGRSHVKVSSSQSVTNERRSPILDQRRPDGSNQHGMITRFKEKASNFKQRQPTETPLDAPPNAFKLGDRVVIFNKRNVCIHGAVRWIGKATVQGVTFTAVGIETDCPVRKEDIEEAIPQTSHYFKVHDPRHGRVVIHEAFVVHEEADALQRPQQHKRDALAKEFGLTTHEIAEQQQALNYAKGKKGIDGQKEGQNRKEIEEVQKALDESISLKEQRQRLEQIRKNRKEIEEVQKALDESISLKEQRQRLEQIKQEREKLNMQPKDPQQNAAATGAGMNIPSVQVPSSHSGTHPPHRGPGFTHRPFPSGGHVGPPHQCSLDENRTSSPSRRPPVRQPSHEYEYIRNETSSAVKGQVNSHEENLYDTIGSRGFQGSQSGAQPSYAYASSSQQGHVQPGGELGLGSTVQMSDPPRYGVIKWIGELPNIQGHVAGVELDEYMDGCSDGTWQERRYFTCPYGQGFFCPYNNLMPDLRFSASGTTSGATPAENPLVRYPLEERADQTVMPNQIVKYLGDERGIQGHQNSCYLDATVFGLFALSDVFDSMFLEEAKDNAGKEISNVLWKGIVNPLRKNGTVRLESVMKLRNKLEELGKMKGVNQDEKDPEEFLNLLFKHILNVEPFVNIKRPYGEESEYFVQLFVDYDESLKLPSVGDLLNKMFREQDITFTQVPSRLLIQVPRFGKQYKTYQKIIPAEKLTVAELTMSPYQCFNCEKPAWKQCSACVQEHTSEKRTAGGCVYFCDNCSKLVHSPKSRSNHYVRQVVPPPEVADVSKLELLSVICIETSHYVCFTRSEGRWIFFDSMANRVFDMYNIPKVVDCTQELNEWVYSGDHQRLLDTPPRELPEYVRRFTQDIYMCVYISPNAGMYGDTPSLAELQQKEELVQQTEEGTQTRQQLQQRLDGAEAEKKSLQEQLVQQMEEGTQARQQVQEFQQRLDGAAAEKKSLQEQLVQQMEEGTQARQQVQELQQGLDGAAAEKKSLQEQLVQQTEEGTQTRQQVQELQRRLDSATAEKKSLQEQLVQQTEEGTQTRQQVQELQQKLDDAAAEKKSLQEQLVQQTEEGTQTRQQVQELQQKLDDAAAEKKSLQEQLIQQTEEGTQTRQQVQELQQRLDGAAVEKKSLQEQLVQQTEEGTQTRQQLQQRIDGAAAEKHQLQQRLHDALSASEHSQQRLGSASAELQGLQDIEPWKVSRDKVQIGTEIGSGGWASVSEGTLRVAIKKLHHQILSPHYIDRFQREMRMLAQVRHPNLVQFLGVVLDEPALRLQEPPMIITELLDVNLRNAYERNLGFNKLSVFQDVARALKYLHERHDSIIHRDVSAPNVLLETLPNGMWKGKVSDLGSANLAKLAHTLAEGAIIYAAPETLPQFAHQAHGPRSAPPPQTTKIDVYSYGVLLCEVVTSRFPDPAQYHDMLGQVQREWPFMYELILSCTQHNPVERPTMSKVLTNLLQQRC